jgi:hypothetical protein
MSLGQVADLVLYGIACFCGGAVIAIAMFKE